MAWLRATMGRSAVSRASADGWKMLEMSLQNGDGTVTLKTRQDQEQMAISVGFSDAKLRALAQAQSQQLQDALQAQYDTPIDFSLMDGKSGTSQEQTPDDGVASGMGLADSSDASETDAEMSSARTTLAEGQHEWIG